MRPRVRTSMIRKITPSPSEELCGKLPSYQGEMRLSFYSPERTRLRFFPRFNFTTNSVE